MPERSVMHATFTVERVYDAAPARVFHAWSDPGARMVWFDGPEGWVTVRQDYDFRVGGRERHRTGPPGGTVHAFDGMYYDIVPNERIIYSYDMHMDVARISVSVATVEFRPEGKGTRLIFTEQGAYLDGTSTPGDREQGTRWLLEKLDLVVREVAGRT